MKTPLLWAARFYDHCVQGETDAVGFDGLGALLSATFGRRIAAAVPEKYTRYSCANHFAVCYHDRQKKADLL